MNDRHASPSPHNTRTAQFTCVGEIRFGPGYYSLRIDGLDFGSRIFGHQSAWSLDDRFLAVQEWHTTKESEGPRTSLAIIDLQENKEWSGPIFAGFCVPISWSDHRLQHNDEACHATGKNLIEKETDVDLIEEWKGITQPAGGADNRRNKCLN